MARMIDADKLKAHYSWWKDGTREMTMGEAKDIFDEIVDLQPTAGRHGHWEANPHDRAYDVCSACGIGSKRREYGTNPDGSEYVTEWSWKYCPNCGAKMDGEEDDD